MIQTAIAGVVGAFLAVIICISISPLRDRTQELAVCRGADRVLRDVKPAGTGKTTVDMACYYEDGSVKNIGNDKAVLGGIGVSVLGGLLLGLAISALLSLRARMRRSPPPP